MFILSQETGIARVTSALNSIHNENVDEIEKATVQIIAQDENEDEIDYCDQTIAIENDKIPMKNLKEWTKEDFDKSCMSIINQSMPIATAVEEFGVPSWLLEEHIEKLRKKTAKKSE